MNRKPLTSQIAEQIKPWGLDAELLNNLGQNTRPKYLNATASGYERSNSVFFAI